MRKGKSVDFYFSFLSVEKGEAKVRSEGESEKVREWLRGASLLSHLNYLKRRDDRGSERILPVVLYRGLTIFGLDEKSLLFQERLVWLLGLRWSIPY